MLKIKNELQRKSNSKLKTIRGYTIIEMAVALILSIIIIYICASLYTQTMQIHRRQQRVMAIERALLDTHLSLEQSLTSLPGRNIGTFTGDNFFIPLLPGAGTSFNPVTRKNEPIRLGIVTPYVVNGQPAFTVIYSDGAIPRLETSEPNTVLGDTGTAKVAIPALSSPSPSNPEPTKLPGSTGNTVNPPPISLDSTLTGLPFIPSAQMFQPGQLMLLAGSPPSKIASNTVPSKARLIKLNSVTQTQNSIGTNPLISGYLNFNYDLCINDCNGTISGLTNGSDLPSVLAIGSLLTPIKVASFYIKQDSGGSYLIRNDNGLILPNGDSYQVQGGRESVLGEADKMTVSYRLADGSLQPTPNTPIVPWLNSITSVDIKLTKGMPGIQGSEVLSRTTDINFPILLRNIN